MFNVVACSARWGLVASIKIEVGVKRRVPLLPWGRVAGRPKRCLALKHLVLIKVQHNTDIRIDGVKTDCFDADGIACHMEMCM